VLVQRAGALGMGHRGRQPSLTLCYNTAAAEMLRARLSHAEGTGGAEALTFHAFAAKEVNAFLGQDKAWKAVKMITSSEEYRLVRAALAGQGVDADDVKGWLGLLSALREVRGHEGKLALIRGKPITPRTALCVLDAYQAAKGAAGKIDYADLLVMFGLLVETSPAFVNRVARYEHVQVDEAQDLTWARWVLAEAAGKKARSMLLVLDEKQAIYGFTGADAQVARDLVAAGAKQYALPVNRRSSLAVVASGNEIAARMADRISTIPAEAKADAPVGAVAHQSYGSAALEAKAVAAAAWRVITENPKTSAAILARVNASLVLCEIELRKLKALVRVRGTAGGAWGSVDGRAFLAYLMLSEGQLCPEDDLPLITNRPLRYLKTDDARRAWQAAKATAPAAKVGEGARANLAFALERHAGSSRGAGKLANDLRELAGEDWARRVRSISAMLVAGLKEDELGDADSATRREFIVALASAATEAGSLAGLKDARKQAKEDEKRIAAGEPHVELSSIHRFKGDEADHVWVIDLQEGILPHKKGEPAEERRILYVAATRAQLTTSFSWSGKKSRFLAELGADGGYGVVVRKKADVAAAGR
jgi:DNA helicase-2/ATP-dependent DNA helicase PcrA